MEKAPPAEPSVGPEDPTPPPAPIPSAGPAPPADALGPAPPAEDAFAPPVPDAGEGWQPPASPSRMIGLRLEIDPDSGALHIEVEGGPRVRVSREGESWRIDPLG
jgi:hypothetical protein